MLMYMLHPMIMVREVVGIEVDNEEWEVVFVASRNDEEFDYDDDDEEEEEEPDPICITDEMGESTNGSDPESMI